MSEKERWSTDNPEYPGLYLASVRIEESNYTLARYWSGDAWTAPLGAVYAWRDMPKPMPYFMGKAERQPGNRENDAIIERLSNENERLQGLWTQATERLEQA